MITILGVGHVFDIHEKLRHEILNRRPKAVAVELDRARYEALKSGDKSGEAPILYRVMSLIQEKIADEYGVDPGSEMLVAISAANEIGATIALIDLPAQVVFKKMMSSMSLKEKLYLMAGMIGGMFASKDTIDREMERYEKNEDTYMAIVEKQMPTVTRVLLDERNEHMAKELVKLEEQFQNVLAVVGDGHIKGLADELENRDVEILRLKDMKRKEEHSEISFSYSYKYDEVQ